MNGLSKGKRFERQIAKLLNTVFGSDVRRTPNSGGLSIKGDLIDLSGVLKDYHWELKAQEKLNIHAALEQSIRDCGAKTPLVVFKRNHSGSFVALRFEDFLNIIKVRQNDLQTKFI